MEKLYNLDYLDQLADGDEGFKAEMLNYFISNSPNVIENLDQLIGAEDWAETREVIHKYIANLNMVGASGILEASNTMEDYAEKRENVDQIPVLWKEIRAFCVELIKQLETDIKT